MKKTIVALLLMAVLFGGASNVYAAQAIPEQPTLITIEVEFTFDGAQADLDVLDWMVTREYYHYQYVDMSAEVPDSIWWEMNIGRDSGLPYPNNIVRAKGTLHWTSTISYWPTPDRKQINYYGILQAYLNGDLLPL